MKLGLLLIFVSGSVIAQANGFYPYYPGIFAKQTQLYSLTENPVVVTKYPTYQQAQQQSQYYYPGQSRGFYPYRPALYPLFYYIPEIRDARLHTMKVPEFHDINDILDKKSEQAMLRNNLLLGHQDPGSLKNHVALSGVQEEQGNEFSLSGMNLSELTASSLIFSARKKQLLETLIPDLLNNHSIFQYEREKLKKMFNDLENGNTISADDENWLQSMIREYRIPGQLLNDTQTDELFKSISQLKKPFLQP